MKILSLLICCVVAGRAYAFDDDFECNMKTCVIDLLDFNDFTFGALIRKIQAVVFCVKQCSPPIVHEFLESISFAFTKKISGKCRHMECVEHNRFVALAHCAKKEAWPLLQCTKTLFDLLQLPLVPVDPVNTTCSIVIETTQCLEETFQKCGEKTISVVREIFKKPLTLGLKTFCRPSHNEQAKTLMTPSSLLGLRDGVYIIPLDDESDLIPVAKGLKQGPNHSSRVPVPYVSLLMCLMVAVFSSFY